MAHFAKIENNTVTTVIVVSNDNCGGGEYPESEPIGQAFIADVLKIDGDWKQTSYSHNFRKQYCGVGFTYLADADVFVSPQPYPSWTLNKNYDWQPPTPKPEGDHYWSEEDLEWVAI